MNKDEFVSKYNLFDLKDNLVQIYKEDYMINLDFIFDKDYYTDNNLLNSIGTMVDNLYWEFFTESFFGSSGIDQYINKVFILDMSKCDNTELSHLILLGLSKLIYSNEASAIVTTSNYKFIINDSPATILFDINSNKKKNVFYYNLNFSNFDRYDNGIYEITILPSNNDEYSENNSIIIIDNDKKNMLNKVVNSVHSPYLVQKYIERFDFGSTNVVFEDSSHSF